MRDLEHVGASLSVETGRESVAYTVQGLRASSTQDVGLNVMAETLAAVTQPSLLEYEVEKVRALVAAEAAQRASQSELTLRDRLHAEAFANTGLAASPAAASWAAAAATPQTLHRYVSERFFPGERLVIVGTGIEHATLVRVLQPLFAAKQLKLRGSYFELNGLPALSAATATSQAAAAAYPRSAVLIRCVSASFLSSPSRTG